MIAPTALCPGCGRWVDRLYLVAAIGEHVCIPCWKLMTLELLGEITLGDWWHAVTGEPMTFPPKEST